MGRFSDALIQIKRAQELDPVTPIITSNAGWAFYLAHRTSEAKEEYHKALELEPNFPGSHRGLGWCYTLDRAYPDAITELHKALELNDSPYNLASLGYANAASGNRAEAEKILRKLQEQSKQKYVPPYFIAVIYSGLGENDRAIDWLEMSYREHFGLLAFLKVEPWFDSLRSDRRFQDLLKRLAVGD
jgi:Flp pilus assembly protein TadD